jgi:Domain of unknown function (DUF4292)
MKRIYPFIVLLIIIGYASLYTSCRPTKNISGAINKKDSTITKIVLDPKTNNDSIKIITQALTKIKQNHIHYNTFSAKVKVEYDAEGQNVPDVTAYIRVKKDSIIWINIEKFLINVARLVITKDSIFVLNKLEKTITKRPFGYLQELAQIPFDFNTVENLLVGNPIYFSDTVTTFKKNENTTALLSIGNLFKHLITINNDNYLIQHSKLDDVDITRNRTCDLSYGDYDQKDNMQFSKERTIVVSEKTKLQIDLKFKQYSFNETLNFPFSIPKSYKNL